VKNGCFKRQSEVSKQIWEVEQFAAKKQIADFPQNYFY